MFIVYAIKSQTRNYIYVGLTKNLDERIKRHNAGYEKTTRSYKPFKLLYTGKCNERYKAREREKYLKSGVGKAFLKNIIRDN